MGKKRNKLEIIYDILSVIKSKNGKIKPTHILYKSNLSHTMMEHYLGDLLSKEMIREIKLKKGKTYEITDKGFSYLSKYDLVKGFTESFGLDWIIE